MNERYRAMLEGGERLGRAGGTTQVMQELAGLMKNVLTCRSTLCYTLQSGGDLLMPVGCRGLAPRDVPLFLRHPLSFQALPLLRKTLQRKHRLFARDRIPPGLFPPELGELFLQGTLLALPMRVRGELVGLAFALREAPFNDSETDLLSWTVSHAALAVSSLSGAEGDKAGRLVMGAGQEDGLKLYEATRIMFVGTVSSLVNAIEAKSTWTKGHSERVMRTCAIIAAAMGLSESEVERVRLGGLLHDIGKIGVEGVLANPGRLDPEEDPPMKLHPEMGVAILSPISELKVVLPGILHHHERFDGRGYPAGLKGEEIPLDARIIAVADAFDAIVSERPYRSGSRRADALVELGICSGSQFDPEIVSRLRGFIREDGGDPLPILP